MARPFARRAFSIFSISFSQFRSYTIGDDPESRLFASRTDATDTALSFTGVTGWVPDVSVEADVSWPDDAALLPRLEVNASRVTLLQLVMLSLRLIVRTTGPSLMSDPARTLLQSSYPRSEDEPGCSCSWMVESVLRTNWLRDMRLVRSATCKSVLSSNNEYDTA